MKRKWLAENPSAIVQSRENSKMGVSRRCLPGGAERFVSEGASRTLSGRCVMGDEQRRALGGAADQGGDV